MATPIKTVEVYKDGALVASFEGTEQAAFQFRVSKATISRACNKFGIIQKIPGYLFRYGKKQG